MKQSQSSSFIKAQSQFLEFQDLNLSNFGTDQRKPMQVRQYRIDQQYQKQEIESKPYLETKRGLKNNKKIKNENEKLITIEEFKNVQKQRRISISKEMYGKFIKQKQKEFLKLLSFCLTILFILVLIFHKNKPVQIQGLFD